MGEAKVRLIIDSAPRDGSNLGKLIELHRMVVEQTMRLNIDEYVRITWELDAVEGRETPPAAAAEARRTADPISALSSRQRQIADMLCAHYSIKRISSELFVSVNTVKKHIQNIKRALKVESSGADFIYLLNRLMQGGTLTEAELTPNE
ncbi:response regulator transcription factor [Cohnella cellulosilytica]|uniref:Response regulator transcription factor n=1 Tax=Cohnella cellulosilytica TaxID=986710 RepID=A0ABW2FB88_9BACL